MIQAWAPTLHKKLKRVELKSQHYKECHAYISNPQYLLNNAMLLSKALGTTSLYISYVLCLTDRKAVPEGTRYKHGSPGLFASLQKVIIDQ